MCLRGWFTLVLVLMVIVLLWILNIVVMLVSVIEPLLLPVQDLLLPSVPEPFLVRPGIYPVDP